MIPSPFSSRSPFKGRKPTAGAAFTVTIAGLTVVGSTLTATPDPGGTYTYQWFRDGSPIGGATSSTYVTAAAGAHTCRAINTGGKARFSNTIIIYSGGGEFTFEFSDEFDRSV